MAAACQVCGGSGQVSEDRLIWKKARADGDPPLRCWKRVISRREGWEKARELPPEAFEVDVVSVSGPCACRAGREAAAKKTVERRAETLLTGWDRKRDSAGEVEIEA